MSDIVYRMNNDTRVKKVLKDLSRLLKEAGVDAKNSHLQVAVARIFGYGSWSDLNESIGGHMKTGMEDNELDAVTLAVRKEAQKAAIARLGMTEDAASQALERLRPTGRVGAAVNVARRIATTRNGDDYHPMRLRNLWDHMHEFEADFDGYFSTVEDMLSAWAERRPLIALDQVVCKRYEGENETNLDIMFDVSESVGFILDASRLVAEHPVTEIDRTMLEVEGIYADHVMYVHFGANAFPSPYPEVGVEGAYVSRYFGGGKQRQTGTLMPDTIDIMFVCSTPYRADFPETGEYAAEDSMLELRNLLRGASLSISPGEDVSLEAVIEGMRNPDLQQEKSWPGHSETTGAENAAWADYMAAPFVAALNAVKVASMKATKITDSAPGGLGAAEMRRLERAVTDAAFLKVASGLEGEIVVRHVDREAPAPELLSEHVASYHDDRAPYDGMFFEALMADAAGQIPQNAIVLARHAFDIANGGYAENDGWSVMLDRARALVIHSCMREMSDRDGNGSESDPECIAYRDEMLLHAHAIVSSRTAGAWSTTIPLAWLVASCVGDERLAASAMARIAESPFEGLREGVAYLQGLMTELSREWDSFTSPISFFIDDSVEGTELERVRYIWDPYARNTKTIPASEIPPWMKDEISPIVTHRYK